MIDAQHIHIMGAPGSGTSTLARLLAAQVDYQHLDSDDYHWFTSDPEPYRRRRNPDHRRQLLTADLDSHPRWILSGSLCGWGDVFASRFDLVVFCTAPAEIRLARIRARELSRYGPERLEPGGDLHGVFVKFLDWAAAYETASDRQRSLAYEQKWVEEHCACKVIYLDTTLPEAALLERILG